MEAQRTPRRDVNNAVYGELGERWYTAKDDPVALLRAQARTHNPWILRELSLQGGGLPCKVLDVGCGAGFLANALAAAGHDVHALDASAEALAVAAEHDETGRVNWIVGDALSLPLPEAGFDAVFAMDFLEHVEDPSRVVAEASRVLAPHGRFFFHTFNRSFLSWLVVIKGVEWFVKNVPRDMHLLRLFVRPDELREMCAAHGMQVESLRRFDPKPWSRAFARMLWTGTVGDDFEFDFATHATHATHATYATYVTYVTMGYTGVARKRA